MKEKFKQLPNALKRQIINRLFFGGLSLFLFILILIFARDFVLSLPGLALSLYFGISGAMMLFNCIDGKYIVITGTCTEIEKTAFRRRLKAFYVSTEDGVWKIVARRKIKRLAQGVEITVYIPAKAHVYKENDVMVVFGFYAHDINSTKSV